MKRLFWVNGRLPWPLVVAIAYVSVSAVILDYVWRVVVIQFDTLLLLAVAAEVAGAILVVLCCYALRRQDRP
jgi:amino acid transporter